MPSDSSGTERRPSEHRRTTDHGTTPTGPVRQDAGSERHGSAERRGRRTTSRRHRCWALEPTRRVNPPPDRTADADEEPFRSALFRCAATAAPLRVATFFMFLPPSVLTPFQFLSSSPPPFHHALGPDNSTDCYVLCTSRVYWLHCIAVCVLFIFSV